MRRSFASTLLFACLAVTSLVLGQPKKSAPVRAKPKPKPTLTAPKESRPDAGEATPKSSDDDALAPGDGPAGGSAEAADPTAGSRAFAGDGGVRTSPLNPRPEELPDGGPVSAPAELDKILGDIAALRARVAAIGDTLFKSRVVLRVETRGDHGKIGKLAVSLDDGIVYAAPPGFFADDETTIYDHAVAPGRHVLGVEIERHDDRGESFRNAERSRFTLEVPENQRLEAFIRIDDDSDMGSDFPSGQKGSYDVRVRVRARAKK